MASAAIDIVANVHLPLPLGKQGVLLFLSCALLVISLGLPSWEMVFQSANLQKNHLFDVMFSIIKCYAITGCGCWYWPRSGVRRRFWVGDGRPTAAGVAYSHHKALTR